MLVGDKVRLTSAGVYVWVIVKLFGGFAVITSALGTYRFETAMLVPE